MSYVVPFIAGVVFAFGLCIAGLTSPAKIIGFLDVQHWDPSLLFAMIGALPVMFVAWRLRDRMARPYAGAAFPVEPPAKLDARLFAGAALFGVGWGLGGFCPGPILVSLGAGARAALILLPSMVGGMLLFRAYDTWQRQDTGEERL